MDMMGHQAVGFSVTTKCSRLPLQLVEIVEIVSLSEEACAAIIASLNNVPGNTGDRESSPSWHGEFLFAR